jgi:penicillin-binding protein 2
MAVALAGLDSKAITPHDRVNCPGYLDLGDTRFHCWRKGGHGSLDLRGGLKHSCDVYFYEIARRIGIDRIAGMANRLGMGVDLPTDLPGARKGLIPTRAWRMSKGKAWNIGDTIVAGIGQGFIQVTPMQLATYASRIATGRAVVPHLTRKIGGVLQPEALPARWPSLGLPDKELATVRQGMWAVVNEGGGTAPVARIPGNLGTLAGKTGSSQVRRVSREAREHGFKSEKLPWEFRPHALFVAYAPYDNPRYALSVVVEHGNAGAQAAAPVARDIMVDVLTRDPSGRQEPPANRVADKGAV